MAEDHADVSNQAGKMFLKDGFSGEIDDDRFAANGMNMRCDASEPFDPGVH